LTNESPGTRLPQESLVTPPPVDRAKGADTTRLWGRIQKLLESRLKEDASIDHLKKRERQLCDALNITILEEKKLRLEKVRTTGKKNQLKERVLILKRERLQKDTMYTGHKTRMAIYREKGTLPITGEVERLEQRRDELSGDLDAFRETLVMHRRDRDRVYQMVIEAQNELQDKLTESLLYQILNVERIENREPERTGVTGVAAELLGRLLVLEKEESYISGIILHLGTKNSRERTPQ
jgi:hypothetical protein